MKENQDEKNIQDCPFFGGNSISPFKDKTIHSSNSTDKKDFFEKVIN